MARQSKATGITINLSDEGRLGALKTILGYEAGVRGLTIGQTFAELVLEAADVENYPDEVRDQLREIRESARRRAAERSIAVAKAS